LHGSSRLALRLKQAIIQIVNGILHALHLPVILLLRRPAPSCTMLPATEEPARNESMLGRSRPYFSPVGWVSALHAGAAWAMIALVLDRARLLVAGPFAARSPGHGQCRPIKAVVWNAGFCGRGLSPGSGELAKDLRATSKRRKGRSTVMARTVRDDRRSPEA